MRLRGLLPAALVLLCGATGIGVGQSPTAGDWVEVDYAELIDRRQLSHSSESVGALLDRLGGRSLPPPGERADDRMVHMLLDPLLEPYAFVLSDVLDARGVAVERPLFEVGRLWSAGQRQPAWVELLRARRYLVESDGHGRFRACLPWSPAERTGSGNALPAVPAPEAAEQAWDEAWPVLRHVLAAERLRLAGDGEPPPIQVEVHAYRHRLERSSFQLGTEAYRVTVADTRPDGRRPPLELAEIRGFLDRGLRLEGGRVEEDGSLRFLGSVADEPPRILGRPIALSDLAVAYRAVVHGGLAEPYMSLDRGYSPQRSIVNYGGRLRDTALGLVSLQCDIRFKTFSLGLDIVTGEDLRDRVRARLPDFLTHLERMARDERSAGIARQHTRLWFYPDRVDLTVSSQRDVLAMRRVRMSAASERLQGNTLAAAGEDEAPWTRATVEAVNRHYEALAGFFPELGDLDQVVRLLSLFTWLHQAERDGRPTPELDALLAVELPALPTPRSFPQLLAFNILPAPGSTESVLVIDRVPVAEALGRLNATGAVPLPARRRYERAVAALDPQEPEHAALLEELQGYDPDGLDDGALDVLAYRAQRMDMLARTSTAYYQRVLGRADAETRSALAERQKRGSELRPFSLGIGGLDLGMGQVLDRAEGSSLDLGAQGRSNGGDPTDGPRPGAAQGAREAWRRDPAGLPQTVLPEHGATTADGIRVDRVSADPGPAAIRIVYDAAGPEPSSRRLRLDRQGRPGGFERLENHRLIAYRVESTQEGLTARVEAPPSPLPLPLGDVPTPLPAGLGLMRLTAGPDVPAESPRIDIELWGTRAGEPRQLQAAFPRGTLQRLVLGHAADPFPGRALSGLAPLPPDLAETTTLMVLSNLQQTRAPWEAASPSIPGEESPPVVARALDDWWSGAGESGPRAVVGVDSTASPERWARAPRPGADALLLLPPGAFTGPIPAELTDAWPASRVVAELPARIDATLVVLVGNEAPAEFARRLVLLAQHEAMRGKLLAAWCLSGAIRADLPASLVGHGGLAGLGLAEASVTAMRAAPSRIGELARQLRQRTDDPPRVEALDGPFLWYF